MKSEAHQYENKIKDDHKSKSRVLVSVTYVDDEEIVFKVQGK